MDAFYRQERERILTEYREKFGTVFGHWNISEYIGSGSFGKVFKIERDDFGHYSSALKVISIPAESDETYRQIRDGKSPEELIRKYDDIQASVVQEFISMAAMVNVPTIVRYEDHVVVPMDDGIGRYVLIRMELLTPYKSYRTSAKEQGFREERVVKMAKDICTALRACHRQQPPLIHRDVKPDNIFYLQTASGDEYFKLGDFGVARRMEGSSDMSHKGTFDYMAPEVAKMYDYDHQVDIYSLGLVLYEACNGGRLPFLGENASNNDKKDAVTRRLNGEELPAPSDCSPRLAEIILRACSFWPEDRYPDADAMLRDLEALDGPVAIVAPAKKPGKSEKKKAESAPAHKNEEMRRSDTAAMKKAEPVSAPQKKKGKGGVIFLVIVLILAAAVAVFLFTGKSEEPPAVSATPAPTPAAKATPTPEPTPEAVEETANVQLGDQSYDAAATRVEVKEQGLEDISAISALSAVTVVNLDGNSIRDVSPLAALSALEALSLQNNGLQSLRGLEGLGGLGRVYLNGNRISDLAPLAGLENLQILQLNDNAVADVGALAGLGQLQQLSLRGNAVSDVTPLAGLTKLEKLSLEGNPVEDVSALAGLTGLKSLDLKGTQVPYAEIRRLQAMLPECSIAYDVPEISLQLQEYQYIYENVDWELSFDVLEPQDLDRSLITWTSSDPGIATVDARGVVSTKKVGNTVITASLEGQESQCKLYVISSGSGSSGGGSSGGGSSSGSGSLKLSASSLTRNSGSVITVEASGTGGKSVTWSVSNSRVLIIRETDSNSVTILCDQAGTAYITATLGGSSASCKVVVNW